MKKLLLLQMINSLLLWWKVKGKHEFAQAYRHYFDLLNKR